MEHVSKGMDAKPVAYMEAGAYATFPVHGSNWVGEEPSDRLLSVLCDAAHVNRCSDRVDYEAS